MIAAKKVKLSKKVVIKQIFEAGGPADLANH